MTASDIVTDHEHDYPPGWQPTDDTQLDTYWRYVEDDMSAWRYCPVCGAELLTEADAVTTEPRCSKCYRPIDACPCACTVKHS